MSSPKMTKKCGCGKEFKKLPKNMDVWREDSVTFGYSWECECGSTLFVRDIHIHMYEFEDPQDWRVSK